MRKVAAEGRSNKRIKTLTGRQYGQLVVWKGRTRSTDIQTGTAYAKKARRRVETVNLVSSTNLFPTT